MTGSGRIDFERINQAAISSLPRLLDDLLPGGKRTSGEYFVRNPTRSDRTPGSFSVSLRTGAYHDRATNEGGGDPVALWAYVVGLSQAEAARELADWLHLPPGPEDEVRRPERTVPERPRPEPNPTAGRIWHGAKDPRGGTLAEAHYRKVRKVPSIPDEIAGRVLRYHPRLWLDEKRPAVPGIVLAYHPIGVDTDEPQAIQRIFLGPDAEVLRDEGGAKIKKMLGPVGGAAIKISPEADIEAGLGIAEGFETALWKYLDGWRPVWALGSAGAIERFPLLAGIEALTIFADNDPTGDAVTGLGAARDCARRWQAAGREVRIKAYRSGAKRDFADRG